MTAAYRLRGLGWFASCAGIVLSFYLVSLQVAQERNRLDALNGRIRVAERDIRALETEFDTRANLQQLERWNGDILALSAPVAAQFMADEARLASVSFAAPAMGGAGEIRTAALVVPSLPAATLQPAVVPAGTAAPVTSTVAVTVAAATSRPAPAKVQRVAMLDDGFLADLGATARAEAAR